LVRRAEIADTEDLVYFAGGEETAELRGDHEGALGDVCVANNKDQHLTKLTGCV
jgi:hypothetical protein